MLWHTYHWIFFFHLQLSISHKILRHGCCSRFAWFVCMCVREIFFFIKNTFFFENFSQAKMLGAYSAQRGMHYIDRWQKKKKSTLDRFQSNTVRIEKQQQIKALTRYEIKIKKNRIQHQSKLSKTQSVASLFPFFVAVIIVGEYTRTDNQHRNDCLQLPQTGGNIRYASSSKWPTLNCALPFSSKNYRTIYK